MMHYIPAYTPPSIAGVTNGTISVPPFKGQDWRLKDRNADGNKYVYFNNENGGQAELEIRSSVVSNIYGNSGVLANQQLPLLQGKSAYVRLRCFGPVEQDPECGCTTGLAPVSASVNVTFPSGVNVTLENIQDILSVAISALSVVDTDNNEVIPLGDSLAIANGAVNK